MKRQRCPLIAVAALILATAGLLWSCSPVKHVPAGSFLLDQVYVVADSSEVPTAGLEKFLRQQPNHRTLGLARMQLASYNLSGSDTTKWINRWLRSLGQAPVIYDSLLTRASVRQLRTAMVNRGYMDAEVYADTAVIGRKRMAVTYHIRPGQPKYIDTVVYDIADTLLMPMIVADTARYGLGPGRLLDRNRLDAMRVDITADLRRRGYYAFNKDELMFIADTVRGSDAVTLTMMLRPVPASAVSRIRHDIRRVVFVTNYEPKAGVEASLRSAVDSVDYRGITVLYGRDRYLRPGALEEKCFLRPGQPYNAAEVDKTYAALARLGIAKFINIEMRPVGIAPDGAVLMDAYILMSRNPKQGVSFEVEGTNSEGDLGFGLGATYQHRNLFRGSELLMNKVHASYESLSGNFDGFVNRRYTEYAGETSISFPRFMLPLMSAETRRRIRANTEFAVSYNYQERPEYTRIIAGAGWKYVWNEQRRGFSSRQTFDLIDINYVKLPKSTLNFLDSVAPTNPLLRYSYEDHFIMRMGYSYHHTNRRSQGAGLASSAMQPTVTALSVSGETAGNLLYAFSKLSGQERSGQVYKIFGIQYAQYVKADFDYSYCRRLGRRHALAARIGCGVAVPYGNSSMVPFEKRFYAGGANSVRGWGVRTLGPGAYNSRNSMTDFINQCGDIRLDLGVEFRTKLFWVLEGALFVDAGNIWTIRDYANQPGGVFRFNSFYKQLAASYGAGLRMDFSYFLLRFDLGVKAHNPAVDQEPWPLLHPNWKRDTNFHFSVGYPF